MIFQDENNRIKAVIVGLIVGTLLIYSQVWRFEFTNFDDEGYVTRNPIVQSGLTGEGVAWAFQNGLMGNWHPITCLSHMLDCDIFGTAAGGHHLVNVAFHIANAVLLFLLLQRMTGSLWRSAVVAALFAWHPLRVESVAWISERKDVLSAFFGLLSLWAYVKYVRGVRDPKSVEASPVSRITFHASRWYWFALLFFALALMSKPMLVTWPFVLLLLDFWPLGRVGVDRWQVTGVTNPTPETARPSPPFYSLVVEKVPFFALSIVMSIVTFRVQRNWGAMNDLERLSIPDRVSNALVSYVRYLGKTLWPTDLAALYPHPGQWAMWQVGGSVLLLLVITAMSMLLMRRQPWIAVGWCWFLGTLVPVIGLVQVGRQALADRYTYLPHIGLFVACVWSAALIVRQVSSRRIMAGIAAGLLLVGCLGVSWKQTGHWRNSVTLFEHTLSVTTNNVVAEYNYAQGLGTVGRAEEAMEHYRRALRIRPDYYAAHVNLGAMLRQLGDLSGATNHLGQAVALEPTNSLPRLHLGLALSAMQDWPAADAQFATASALGTTEPKLPAEWAKVLLAQKKTREAADQFRASLQFEPDSLEALNNLAWILATDASAEVRNGDEAVRHALRACQLTFYQQTLLIGTLAAAYAEAGQFEEACRTAEQAIALAEKNGETALAERNRDLLHLYQATKPYREQN